MGSSRPSLQPIWSWASDTSTTSQVGDPDCTMARSLAISPPHSSSTSLTPVSLTKGWK